jgi:hypothetical protein
MTCAGNIDAAKTESGILTIALHISAAVPRVTAGKVHFPGNLICADEKMQQGHRDWNV